MQLRRTPNHWRKLRSVELTAAAGLLCPSPLEDSPLRRTSSDTVKWRSPLFVRHSSQGDTFRGRCGLRDTRNGYAPRRAEFNLRSRLNVKLLKLLLIGSVPILFRIAALCCFVARRRVKGFSRWIAGPRWDLFQCRQPASADPGRDDKSSFTPEGPYSFYEAARWTYSSPVSAPTNFMATI